LTRPPGLQAQPAGRPPGIPLAVTLTGGNRNDVTQVLPLIDGVARVRGKDQLIADRGYDFDRYRREPCARGVMPVIARRNTEHGSASARCAGSSSGPSPGCTSSAACPSAGNAAPIRWERGPELHEVFLSLACALIGYDKSPGSESGSKRETPRAVMTVLVGAAYLRVRSTRSLSGSWGCNQQDRKQTR
jgi:hypothetical protein